MGVMKGDTSSLVKIKSHLRSAAFLSAVSRFVLGECVKGTSGVGFRV